MVDVSGKPPMRRLARARVRFIAAPETLDRVMDGALPKGEALAVARVAGITAAKQVDRLVPLCHPLALDHVGVTFQRTAPDTISIETTAQVTAPTGVEMEALTAASVAALTLWDMTKGVDTGLRIDGLELVEKTKRPLPNAHQQ